VLSFGTSSNISLYRSSILANSYDGLHIAYNAQTSITQSTLAGNGQYGAWLEYCDWGNITLNEFSNNTAGMLLDDCMYYKIWHNNFINNTFQAGDTPTPGTTGTRAEAITGATSQ
jgi:parallel beta-helix repeat protein